MFWIWTGLLALLPYLELHDSIVSQEYEGIYVYSGIEVEVKSANKQLLLTGSGTNVILAYKEPLKFQVHVHYDSV